MAMSAASVDTPWSRLRLRTASQIRIWEGKDPNDYGQPWAYNRMAKILGYEENKLVESFTDSDARVCEALLGPNGYTIYKMLLARLNAS